MIKLILLAITAITILGTPAFGAIVVPEVPKGTPVTQEQFDKYRNYGIANAYSAYVSDLNFWDLCKSFYDPLHKHPYTPECGWRPEGPVDCIPTQMPKHKEYYLCQAVTDHDGNIVYVKP